METSHHRVPLAGGRGSSAPEIEISDQEGVAIC